MVKDQVEHLRSRAQELMAAAATTHDEEIARALREVAMEFEVEACVEAASKRSSLEYSDRNWR